MHHITLLMMDLSDPQRFKTAQDVLQSVKDEVNFDILKATADKKAPPVMLTFRGMSTFQSPKKTRLVFCEVLKDKSHDTLLRIASLLSQSMLAAGVVTKNEV